MANHLDILSKSILHAVANSHILGEPRNQNSSRDFNEAEILGDISTPDRRLSWHNNSGVAHLRTTHKFISSQLNNEGHNIGSRLAIALLRKYHEVREEAVQHRNHKFRVVKVPIL